MNAIVVYESFWGNTAGIARAIAEGIGAATRVFAPEEATQGALAAADLVVVGAPVLGFSLPTEGMRRQIAADRKAPSPANLSHRSMRTWLDALPTGGGRYAAFETGFRWSPGGATKHIARALEAAGYRSAAKPERFIVAGTYGPMRDGEVERARAWGATLASAATS